jgi:predicted acyl esterase
MVPKSGQNFDRAEKKKKKKKKEKKKRKRRRRRRRRKRRKKFDEASPFPPAKVIDSHRHADNTLSARGVFRCNSAGFNALYVAYHL